ncbi:MAG: glycosyltransferase 87 family protein [Chloroflexota bacterium]
MTPRRILLVVLAAIGASFLIVVAVSYWPVVADEHAYWLAGQRVLAGQPLYDPTAASNTPYAYWYPPIVAQVLAPVAAVVPSAVFSIAWILVMLGCLFWLAGRDILVALAMCAFPPIAVEFVSRNVHLIIAVLLVLGLRRWGGWFSVGAAIKLAPVLGIPYLVLRGRVRDAVVASAFGLGLLVISVALAPDLWRQFLDVLRARGPADASALLPVPYAARFVAGAVLTVIAARIEPRFGEPLLVVAVTVALPTLWVPAFATLAAVVPLVRTPVTASDVPGRSVVAVAT